MAFGAVQSELFSTTLLLRVTVEDSAELAIMFFLISSFAPEVNLPGPGQSLSRLRSSVQLHHWDLPRRPNRSFSKTSRTRRETSRPSASVDAYARLSVVSNRWRQRMLNFHSGGGHFFQFSRVGGSRQGTHKVGI